MRMQDFLERQLRLHTLAEPEAIDFREQCPRSLQDAGTVSQFSGSEVFYRVEKSS
jgi:hypothetical protein